MADPIQSSSGQASGTTSNVRTLSGVAAGDTLVLLTVTDTAITQPSTPTDSSGDTWTLGGFAGGNSVGVSLWYKIAASAGTHTVTATMPSGTTSSSCCLSEFGPATAVDGTVQTNNGVSQASPYAGLSITPTQSGDIVVYGLGAFVGATITWTVATGYTTCGSFSTGTSDPPFIMAVKDVTGTATETPSTSWTGGSISGFSAVMMAFKAVSKSVPAPAHRPKVLPGLGPNPLIVVAQQGQPSPNVTAVLTGVTGTGSVGTLGVAIDMPLTQDLGTGSVGTVSPANSVPLTEVAGTGAAGTVTATLPLALTEAAGTGAVGTVAPATAPALTAAQATGAVGTVAPANSVPLTEVAGTGAVGTVSASSGFTIALTGVSATGSVGSVGEGDAEALTAVSATGSLGAVSVAVDMPLTAAQATGSVGSVSPNTAPALAGVAATGAAGSVVPNTTVALTGVAATGSVGIVSPSIGFTLALTGVAATATVGSAAAALAVPLTPVQGFGSAPGTVVASGGTGPAGNLIDWLMFYRRRGRR
jgi:hypothetical protein